MKNMKRLSNSGVATERYKRRCARLAPVGSRYVSTRKTRPIHLTHLPSQPFFCLPSPPTSIAGLPPHQKRQIITLHSFSYLLHQRGNTFFISQRSERWISFDAPLLLLHPLPCSLLTERASWPSHGYGLAFPSGFT